MDFSSLVLMERDKETNFLTREIGSYEVSEGAKFITKMFYQDGIVNVYFDTQRDVEDWEFSAAYDLIDEKVFSDSGFDLQDVDDEFNPTWMVKFEYVEDHSEMENKINELCSIIDSEMYRIFDEMKDKEEEYK
ncbi:MAG: hypothetical protein Q8936_04670 [Bacillota bacterium]|nr:hypothetical protein [Bacillota bacterium]